MLSCHSSIPHRLQHCQSRGIEKHIYLLYIPRMKVKALKREKSLILTLSSNEMAALEKLAGKRGLTKSAVLRQSLRLFESLDSRISNGERLVLEAPRTKEKSEVLLI